MEGPLLLDLFLVIGCLILVLAVPSVVSAWSQGRVPAVPSVLVMAGGGLVIFALTQAPSGYRLQDIPEAFVNVAAWALR
ncbi:MAG: hypothetical protein ACU0BS_08640 [Hasllibacter sp.]